MAARLKRWNKFLLVFIALVINLGLVDQFVSVGLLGNPNPDDPNYQIKPGETALTTLQRVDAAVLGLVNIYVFSLAMFAWWC